MKQKLLLDTHVLIWLINGDSSLSIVTKKIIKDCCKVGFLLIPAISIWEISLLESKKRIYLDQPIHQWVEKIIALPYMKVINLDHKIAIESCNLPGIFHGDPADRIIVATSRIYSTPLLTRDQKIIEYSRQSFVKTIEC